MKLLSEAMGSQAQPKSRLLRSFNPERSWLRTGSQTFRPGPTSLQVKHRRSDELKADVVLMDEKAARESARELGLKVAGTMRVLELAFERKLIADLSATYRRLKAGCAHIAPDLLNASLIRHGLPPIE